MKLLTKVLRLEPMPLSMPLPFVTLPLVPAFKPYSCLAWEILIDTCLYLFIYTRLDLVFFPVYLPSIAFLFKKRR